MSQSVMALDQSYKQQHGEAAAHHGHHAAGGADVCSGQAVRAAGGDAEELDECVRWHVRRCDPEEEHAVEEAVRSATACIFGSCGKVGLWRRAQIGNSSCDGVGFAGSII